MKKALLLAAAALLALGCAAGGRAPVANTHHVVAPSVAAPVAVASVHSDATAPMVRTRDVQLSARASQRARETQASTQPSQHAKDVHAYWEQREKELIKGNTEGFGKAEFGTKQAREAREMIEKKKKATIMGDLDSPGPTNLMSDKMKREAKQMIKGMRQAVMNSLDEPIGTDTRSVNLTMRDVNTSRMNGAGLVGMEAHDHFITRGECPRGRCVNGAAGAAGRVGSLGNPVDP